MFVKYTKTKKRRVNLCLRDIWNEFYGKGLNLCVSYRVSQNETKDLERILKEGGTTF